MSAASMGGAPVATIMARKAPYSAPTWPTWEAKMSATGGAAMEQQGRKDGEWAKHAEPEKGRGLGSSLWRSRD